MIECPWCKVSYYKVFQTVSTTMYWAQVYKDGEPCGDNDPNYYTDRCQCLNCGQPFTIQRHMGKVKVEKAGRNV